MTAGYVYLLKAETGHWKIGRTKDPDDRLRTFNVKLPFKVEYEHLIKCDNAEWIERSMHDRYENRRINGEWFALTDEDVAWIKQLESSKHYSDLCHQEWWSKQVIQQRLLKERKEREALENPDAKWSFQWRGQTWETTTKHLQVNTEMINDCYPVDCATDWYEGRME